MLPQPLIQCDPYLLTIIQNTLLYILNRSSISRAVLMKSEVPLLKLMGFSLTLTSNFDIILTIFPILQFIIHSQIV